MKMTETEHRIDYNEEDIEKYVKEIRRLTHEKKYQIEYNTNRDGNNQLIQEFYFDKEKRSKVLSSLTKYDFCMCTKNRKVGFTHEILYIFHKKVLLQRKFSENAKEEVHLYIKINKLTDYYFVVSLHEEEYPLQPKWGDREKIDELR